MKRINALIVMAVLGVGSMAFGEDKILFDGSKAVSSAEVKADPENADNKALFWFGANKGSGLTAVPADKNWSTGAALSFKMYTNEADGHEIMIVCESNPEGTEGNYYFKKIKIDWKGWKTISIPFKEFGVSRNVIGWTCITRFMIATKGWGCEPNPNAEYYIGDVKLLEAAEKAK